ncbi:tripartite tricarboxylate transporter substrate binding protein [Acuticoccus kandeliae]|uniref:tripartite tricarboxylate transporter substrate binding protein n=1 Tax=Acuticoccus kandeliae TaxID=2073160 RepID=UPI000D3EA458|nr:tripartite tricarboxylate transporter substrate binding protein [Acuticoccus kandeliae]
MRHWIRQSMVAAAAVVALSGPALADWPEKDITLVLPSSPGGAVDQLMLPLKPLLEKELGVNVLLEYRPGGSSQIGAQLVAARGGDGYTIGALLLPHIIGTVQYQTPAYTLDDFTPAAIISGDVPIWFTSKNSPYNSMNDLIEAARERPGEVTVAIGTFTGEHYITLLQIEDQGGVKFRTVNVGGGSEVMSGVVGEHFDVGISRPASILSVKDDIKGLGIVSDARAELYPDTATFDEQLTDPFKIAHLRFAVGVMATTEFAKDDPDGFQKLVDAIDKSVHSEEYVAGLTRAGRELTYMGPEKAKGLVDEMSEVMAKYKPLVEAAQKQ